MQHRILVLVIFLYLVVLSACCSTTPKSGIPEGTWNKSEKPQAYGLASGFIGAYIGSKRESVVKGGVVSAPLGALIMTMNQENTCLTPAELSQIIVSTLAIEKPPHSVKDPYVASASEGPTRHHATAKLHEFNWGIAESNEGEVVTNWIPIQGRVTGLLWWRKEYQTQVRHVITIRLSLDMTQHCSFSIITEVRERPNSTYPWVTGDPELGRDSFEQLQKTLMDQIHKLLYSRRKNVGKKP